MNLLKKSLLAALILIHTSLICANDNRPYPMRHKEKINNSTKIILADNGAAMADIIIPEKCSRVVNFAAKELKKYLDESTGAKFKIMRSDSFKGHPQPVRTRTAILLGESPWTKAMTGVNFASLPRDSFVIKEVNNAIIIAGHDDPFTDPEEKFKSPSHMWHHYEHATLFGVYDFLERFVGVRFYFPIEELIYTPKHKQLQIPSMNIEESPDFTARSAYWTPYSEFLTEDNCKWATKDEFLQIRNFQTLYGRNETLQIPNCHGLQGLGLITRFGESHPEYFAVMKNGKRANTMRRERPGEHGAHLCYSNKELEDVIFEDAKSFLSAESASVRNIQSKYKGVKWNRAIYYAYPGYFNIHPSDGMIMCYCPKCKPYADSNRISDLFYPFVARIAKRLKEAGIKGTITTMPYTYYRPVPKCDLPDNIEIMYATLGPWNEPNLSDEELSKPDQILVEWSKKNNGKKSSLWNYMISDRGMTHKGIPPMSPRYVSSYYKRNASVISGSFTQTGILDIIHNYLNIYVFYKTSWDTSTDVEALLAEHHEKLFGPAAKPMGKFYDLLETLWVNRGIPKINVTPLGPSPLRRSEYEIWDKNYTSKELENLAEHINKAEELTQKSPSHLKRVRFIRKHFLESMENERKKYLSLKREIEDLVLEVPIFNKPIKIDGIFDEDIWKKSSSIYINPVNQDIKPIQTEMKIFSDKNWLYLGFTCQEPKTANMKLDATKRDGNVWADSCVEIILKLSNNREPVNYYHFMVNANGIIADEERITKKDINVQWNSDVQAKTRINDKNYTIELRIPIEKMLGRSIKPGDELIANFTRSRFLQDTSPQSPAEPYSSWSPYLRFSEKGFHDITRFGILRFVTEDKKKRR